MRLESVTFLDAEWKSERVFRQFASMTIRLNLGSEDPDLAYPYVSLTGLDNWSQAVCHTVTGPPLEDSECAPGCFSMDLVFESLLLLPGCYSMDIIVAASSGTILDSWIYGESFSVLPRMEEARYQYAYGGVFSHPCKWVTHRPEQPAIPQPEELRHNES
jgi:hypothetical protein